MNVRVVVVVLVADWGIEIITFSTHCNGLMHILASECKTGTKQTHTATHKWPVDCKNKIQNCIELELLCLRQQEKVVPWIESLAAGCLRPYCQYNCIDQSERRQAMTKGLLITLADV